MGLDGNPVEDVQAFLLEGLERFVRRDAVAPSAGREQVLVRVVLVNAPGDEVINRRRVSPTVGAIAPQLRDNVIGIAIAPPYLACPAHVAPPKSRIYGLL